MKKITLRGLLALVLPFAFTSCDEIGVNFNEVVSGELDGNVTMTIARTTADGTTMDTLEYSSSIVDIFDFAAVDPSLGEGYSTISISANIDFNQTDVALEFPFMYYRLNDSTTGAYTFDTILTLEMLQNLNFDSLINIIANPDGGNMILIAENDSCWYVTYGGQFVVSEFPTVGHLVKASFSNVDAWYITQSKVDELSNDIDNMNYTHLNDIDYYFPRVKLSGNLTSRRWAVIHNVFNAAFTQGGIGSK
jgi:hypothetical protein